MHKNVMFNIIYFFCSFVSSFSSVPQNTITDYNKKKVLPDAFWVLLFLFLFGLLVCFTFFFPFWSVYIFSFQHFTFLFLFFVAFCIWLVSAFVSLVCVLLPCTKQQWSFLWSAGYVQVDTLWMLKENLF